MYEFIDMWKRGLNFKGRSTRLEYWSAILVNLIITLLFISIITGSFLISINIEGLYKVIAELSICVFCWMFPIYMLISFIPLLALNIRRLHDIGKSGWYILINIIPIVGQIIILMLYCTDSKVDSNKYGAYRKNTDNIKENNKKALNKSIILTIITIAVLATNTFITYKIGTHIKLCPGGTICSDQSNCNKSYLCSKPSVCPGGTSTVCSNQKFCNNVKSCNAGTVLEKCIHGRNFPHWIYCEHMQMASHYLPCQHGYKTSHTIVTNCIHGQPSTHPIVCEHNSNIAHTIPCEHGLSESHIVNCEHNSNVQHNVDCIHGQQNKHYYLSK